MIVVVFLGEPDDDESIPEKSKKSLEDNEGVAPEDDQNFDSPLPKNKSTPVKSNTTNDRKQSTDAISDNENFNQVSALLMNAASSYDTLKLFKTKSKSSSDESKSSENVSHRDLVTQSIYECLLKCLSNF